MILILLFLNMALAISNQNFDSSLKSDHIDLYWNKDTTSQKEVDDFIKYAENNYSVITKILSNKKNEIERIHVYLCGYSDFSQPNTYPFTDISTGWIYLFENPQRISYKASFSHEIVHALRHWYTKGHSQNSEIGFIFLEEGLAEYVSSIAVPNKDFFSLYGLPLDFVAGYLVKNNLDIPLEMINSSIENADLEKLNVKCRFQTYPLRASFYNFLDEVYGRNLLIKLIYFDGKISPNIYNKIYNKPFDVLVTEWKKWITNKFSKISTSTISQFSNKYKERTKDKYFCQKAKDF